MRAMVVMLRHSNTTCMSRLVTEIARGEMMTCTMFTGVLNVERYRVLFLVLKRLTLIKRIVIENFQSHKHTAIELSSGVNAIVGTSNSGKTAILRALLWVINNRPRGNAFIRHGQTEANVGLHLDSGCVISRNRNSKNNKYNICNDGEAGISFEALGGDVPEEVSALLNFSDINVQEQLSPYFLVLESPGKIGQYINGIVKLDEIDEVVKNLSGKIRKSDDAVASAQDDINALQEKIDAIRHVNVEEFEEDLQKASNLLGARESLRIKGVSLQACIKSLDEVEC